MFTHLHVHTEYSLLDGKSRIKELVARTKELGMTSLAITDHGVMYGCLSFYQECKKQGIKPIIGCEVYVAPNSRFDKQGSADTDDRYHHLVLLVENDIGYKNLCKICTTGFTEGFYYKPRVDEEILRQYSEGLICLSACLAGAVPNKILKGDYESAKQQAITYQEIFSKERFFIELQDHGIKEEKQVAQPLIRIAQEIGAELVVTNDSHYTTKDEAPAHDILLCMQTGKKLSDENRLRFDGEEFYLKSEEEMRQLFPAFPQAYDNTCKVAEMCNFDYELGITRLPVYDYPPEYTNSYEYMKYLCNKGLKERYGENVQKDKIDLLEYELNVIKNMGYVDYFLIVWDFINYAREHDIPVGPGRGSGAGSICAYCMYITNIDPVKYGLFFERFLNPERVSMPDFDIDFCYDRGVEVEEYVINKYGAERVSKVITYQTMAARGSIRDVGRVLDYPYTECDKIAKLIPNELNITIDKALGMSNELKSLYDSDQKVKYLIDIARKIEGMPKSISQHAAGLLICDKPVVEYAPLTVSNDSVIIQARKEELEDLGLLKFDFLKLRTLTVIYNTIKNIEKRTGKKIDIDTIDLYDKKVFENLSTGKMYGVFQFESAGMKDVIAKLQPTSIEDLTAVISLYRPGPMDSIPRYIRNRFHQEEITYYHPCVEEILKPTYGCLVYQEQIMKVFQVMAGFSLGRADIVRRAMSKKKDKVLKEEFEYFKNGLEDKEKNIHIEGALKKGIPEETCNQILTDMTDFSKYAFNKSHAACYAVVAYQTAYLVNYYPVEFFAAYLTSFLDDNKQLKKRCSEVKKEAGINIASPDINISETNFVCDKNQIVFGLGALSGIGSSSTQKIVQERENNGNFKNLFDLVTRMITYPEINKKAYEALIKSGTLDSISEGHNRNELLAGFPILKTYAENEKNSSMSGQMSLFNFLDEDAKLATIPKIPKLPDLDDEIKLQYEKDVAYMYLSKHPLENYRKWIKGMNLDEISDITDSIEDNNEKYQSGMNIVAPVIISDIKKIISKKNTNVWFFKVSDEGDSIDAVGFETFVNKYGYLLEENTCCIIKGKLDEKQENTWQIMVNEVIPFPKNNAEIDNFLKVVKPVEAKKQVYHQKQENIQKPPVQDNTKYNHGVHILVPNKEFAEKEIYPLINGMPGMYPVYVYFKEERLGGQYPTSINIDSPNLRTIVEKVGMSNAKWF